MPPDQPPDEPAPRAASPHELEALPLFVYGTLRVGQANYRRYLAGHTVRELAAILPDHWMYALTYPCAVDAADDGQVIGELMYLRPDRYAAILADVDGLEGFQPGDDDSLYMRVRRPVRYADAGGQMQSAAAWVYHAGPRLLGWLTEHDRVPGGDWLAHLRSAGLPDPSVADEPVDPET